ncbi:MAG: septum formation protein Maf [Puniceicoccaceae bacterium]|nr:MAG: septum formation protein Maf [Puniceicoccaceae bacterium]
MCAACSVSLKTELILASGSPRRRQLLEEAGLRFRVVVPEVEELESAPGGPEAMVIENARRKAARVREWHPGAVVLAADTTVHLDGRIFNKPADREEAVRMLAALAGRPHWVSTAVALGGPAMEAPEVEVERSRVVFKPLDPEAITGYLNTINPLDKAGGYAIQENGAAIVDHYEGSLTNIIGLPMESTLRRLRTLGVGFQP